MFRMRGYAVLLFAVTLLSTSATPIGDKSSPQIPLEGLETTHHTSRQLHGKFLHITDLHPDQFYKIHTSTEEDDACHRGKGPAGTYGAETSDCDTPFSLVNATFKWIKENIRDEIDFVVWTGDSARHDSDEKIPRTQNQVLETNRFVVDKFVEVFGNGHDDEDPTSDMMIPIISTFGNNDILPHNILQSGPNKWLKMYTDVWRKFIPEEQRHGFERGGWYYVEVIPNKLAVFNLNTLYFFDNNAAVDGCAVRSEPGYEQMEWLRIQLQFIRERGMKAILIGHVPPGRTASKQLWDETCWQKYTLWLERYRDVVVGGFYGHMNIDHFMLQDTKEIDILSLEGIQPADHFRRATMDDDLSIMSASDYLEELRESWSSIPNPKLAVEEIDAEDDLEELSDVDEEKKKKKKKKGKKSKKDKALKKIGGPWGERYQVSNVGPSVVPNYLPTLRVVEYNITGLDTGAVWPSNSKFDEQMDWLDEDDHRYETSEEMDQIEFEVNNELEVNKKKKKKGKKGKKPKKPKNPDLIVPDPPAKSSPPGPAYSPQTFTLLGYTQYFANLTHINNDFVKDNEWEADVDTESWHEGKHQGKRPKDKVPKPKKFKYEVEYDTFTDPIYKLQDMTVKSYLKLAHRIGQYKPPKEDQLDEGDGLDEPDTGDEASVSNDDDNAKARGKKDKKKRKKNHRKQKGKNKVWLSFVKRAFVGTLEDEDLQKFEQSPLPAKQHGSSSIEMHDGEL